MDRFHRNTAMLALLIAPLALGACDDDDDLLTSDEQVFTAELQAMNSSGVDGLATFTIDDGLITAEVAANGLDATIHPQHIHLADRCPTAADDANGDGFVDVVEGVPAYGPILVPLDGDLTTQAAGQPDGFPTGATIDYDATADVGQMLVDLRAADPNSDDAVAKLNANGSLSLSTRTVVVHGVAASMQLPATVQSLGETPANVTLPVACGTVVLIDD